MDLCGNTAVRYDANKEKKKGSAEFVHIFFSSEDNFFASDAQPNVLNFDTCPALCQPDFHCILVITC